MFNFISACQFDYGQGVLKVNETRNQITNNPNSPDRPLSFDIVTTWNGNGIAHEPAEFTFDSSDNDTLLVSVSSYFNNDPEPPAPRNSSYIGIWQYEGIHNISKNPFIENTIEESFIRLI